MWSTANSEASLAGAPLAVRVNRRARRLRLRMAGGRLVLTVPTGVSRRRALAWAAGHEGWAREVLAKAPVAVPIGPGSRVPYRGAPLTVCWQTDLPRTVRWVEDRLELGGPEQSVERRVLAWLKREALALLTPETEVLARRLGIMLEGVSVADPRSRWGSCSSSKSIRYSWRLVMAPDFVRKATVAHEAAHLVHMHHQPSFHALVEELLGRDPAPARAWLKREGASLHAVGRAV
jgi:predicted metal-dependent hydrolase